MTGSKKPRSFWLRTLRRLLILLFLVVGILLAVVCWLFYNIDDYRSNVEDYLSQELGYNVEMGELDAAWIDGRPRLLAKQVSIARPNDTIRFSQVALDVSVLESLDSQTPVIERLDVRNLSLDVSEHVASLIDAINSPSAAPNSPIAAFKKQLTSVLQTMPSDVEFVLSNAELYWWPQGAKTKQAVNVNARLWTHSDEEKRFVITTEYAPEAAAVSLDVHAKHWRNVDDLVLDIKYEQSPLPIQWLESLAAIAGIDAGCESPYWVSSSWNINLNEKQVLSKGKITFSDQRSNSEQRLAPLTFDISSLAKPAHWQTTIQHAAIDAQPVISLFEQITLLRTDTDWGMGINTLYLDPLAKRASTWCSKDSTIAAQLKVLQPTGRVKDFELGIAEDGAVQLTTHIKRLSVAQTDQSPGIKNLSGKLTGELTGASDSFTLDIDSQQFAFQWDKYLRSTLRFDRLQGPVTVHPSQGWRVESGELQLASKEIAGKVVWGLDPENDYQLDVDAELSKISLTAVSGLLPATMGAGGLNWVDQGLVAGVGSGTLNIHGPALAIPFYNKEGVFDIKLSINQGIVQFAPEWPRISAPVLDFSLHNSRIGVSAPSALTEGITATKVKVEIPDFRNTVIHVDMQGAGKGQDLVDYVANSPLAKKIPTDLSIIKVSKDATLALSLKVPADDASLTTVKGRVSLSGNQIDIPQNNTVLKQVAGTVKFTEKSFSSSKLKLNYQGFPVTIDAEGDADGLKADLHGTIRSYINRSGGEKQALAAYVPPTVLSYLNGRTHWRLSVQQTPSGFAKTIRYNLTPLALKLPEPLGKSQGEPATLVITLQPYQGNQERLQVAYKLNGINKVMLHGVVRKNAIGDYSNVGVAVAIGQQRPALPSEDGVTVTGHISTIKLREIQNIISAVANPEKPTGLVVKPSKKPKKKAVIKLNSVDLTVDRFNFGGGILQDVQFNLQQVRNDWLVTVNAPDVEGTISVPKAFDERSVLDVNLSKFKLDPFFPQGADANRGATVASGSVTDKKVSTTLPQNLPAFNLQVDKLLVNDLLLGELKLRTVPDWKGFSVKNATLKGPMLNADLKGAWSFVDNNHYSELVLGLKTNDINRLLSALGFVGQIKAKSTTITLDSHWQGTLADLSFATMRGKASINIGKGELLAVDPGAGKILSLFSFVNLPRRLMLDFSDITAKGLLFDKIKGSFSIGDGELYTTNARIESSTADVKIVGRIGVKERDFDQYITVYPKVSSTLSILGGLVGGVEVGAVFLILQPLFGFTVDEMTAQYFVVKGPWLKPEFSTPDGKPLQLPSSKKEGKSRPATGPRRR